GPPRRRREEASAARIRPAAAADQVTPIAHRSAARNMIGIRRVILMDRTETGTMSPSWRLQDAVETYGIRHWGKGYFGINDLGHVTVHPDKTAERSIDLKDLVDQLNHRGIQLPILL